jgi:hypothetical protein
MCNSDPSEARLLLDAEKYLTLGFHVSSVSQTKIKSREITLYQPHSNTLCVSVNRGKIARVIVRDAK